MINVFYCITPQVRRDFEVIIMVVAHWLVHNDISATRQYLSHIFIRFHISTGKKKKWSKWYLIGVYFFYAAYIKLLLNR